jgi:hypothetical protein
LWLYLLGTWCEKHEAEQATAVLDVALRGSSAKEVRDLTKARSKSRSENGGSSVKSRSSMCSDKRKIKLLLHLTRSLQLFTIPIT